MLKKRLIKFISFFLLFLLISMPSYCSDKSVLDDVLESQKDTLGIGDFLEESKKYTDNTLR